MYLQTSLYVTNINDSRNPFIFRVPISNVNCIVTTLKVSAIFFLYIAGFFILLRHAWRNATLIHLLTTESQAIRPVLYMYYIASIGN